jgi:DUF1680 family protein
MRLTPLEGTIDGGFWGERQRLNREVLIPAGERELERAGAFANLRTLARGTGEAHRGPVYQDSDLYKWLEAVGWELRREPTDELERMARSTTALLEAAQDADGYLNTCYQIEGRARWSNLAWDHELYCAGHLIQAAVAGAGNEALRAVARRLADHLVSEFAAAGTCGHPEIELALVALYRETGAREYLELAAKFLDRRGHGTLQPAGFGPAYFQDRVPVREQRVVEGHAVRALYLACGATDLFLETGEVALLDAMRAWWEDMVAGKTYVTGGIGSDGAHEAFGPDYDLPPERAYAETCAAIASVMWNWRMLLATGDPRYADLLERTLYNGVLAGVALDGSGYAYVNPLQVRDGGGRFYPWFECACCPPNVMRLLASLHRYLATSGSGGVQVHQYASGVFGPVRVETAYPWDGAISVTALEAGEWTLSLRVPSWCSSARLDGVVVAPGYVELSRDWRPGEEVLLELDMGPRLVAPHPRIDAVRGCVAIERGPFVYCLESADAPAGAEFDALHVAGELRAVARPDVLGGIVAVEAEGLADSRPVTLLAVPYALWGNRGPGAMRVWTPQSSSRPSTTSGRSPATARAPT